MNIMEIATGDMISADARLLETQELRVDESSLTGESNPVKKDGNLIFDNPKTPVAERVNMLYSGCFVTGGEWCCGGDRCGNATEFGSIARGALSGRGWQDPSSGKAGPPGQAHHHSGGDGSSHRFYHSVYYLFIKWYL